MGEKGFSFVELAIATGIFVAASLGITKLMLHVTQGTEALKGSETAFSQLEQKLYDLKSAPAVDALLTSYQSIRNDQGGNIDAGEINDHSTTLQLHWQVAPWSLQAEANGELSIQTGSYADNALKEVTIAVTLENGANRQVAAVITKPDVGSISDIWLINRAATP